MDSKEYSKIVAGNLKRIMYDRGKTQVDIVRDLKISRSTISAWMNGTRTPKMPSIDLLCKYLNCVRSDLMEPPGTKRKTRSVSNDQADLINLVLKASPENVSLCLSMLRKLEGIE